MSDDQYNNGYSYGDDSRDTSMDTAQFIALNAQYLNDSNNQRTSGTNAAASGSTSPVNPLVAAREATGVGQRQDIYGAQPSQELYPIAAQAARKEIDTSFGERRHVGRIILVIVIILVVLILIAGGIFLFLRNQARNEATDNLKTAWSSVATYNTMIDELSNAISNEITNGVADQGVSDAMLNSEGLTNALNSAASAVQTNSTSKYFLASDQIAAIDAMNASIDARRSIVSVGRDLLLNDTASASTQVTTSLDAVYASIADATNNINASGSLFQQYSDTLNAGGDVSGINLADCVNADNVAVTDIQNAQQQLTTAQQTYTSADFSAISTYLTDALNAYTALANLHTTYLNGDVANQQAAWDAYNAAQATLATSAASLPADTATALSVAYRSVASGYADTYESAVSKMQTNDATVVDYLESQGESVEAPISTLSTAGDTVASSAVDALAADAAGQTATEQVPTDGTTTDATATDTTATDVAATDAATTEAAPAADATAQPVDTTTAEVASTEAAA